MSLFNGTLVLGTIILGAQTDRLHVTTVILISAIGAAGSVFILWGISVSLPALCVFSIVYGFFAGAFSTSWSAIIQEIRDRNPDADAGIVFAMLAAGRGIGNLASGPISDAILSSNLWQINAGLGYGTRYSWLIIFIGITATMSGFSWVGRKLGWA